MAAPLFYNQGDQNIYKDFQFVPQEKYRLGFTAPTTTPTAAPVSGGITNTNAFTNSGGNDFNQSGNAFGYGSPVEEVNVRTFNPQPYNPTGGSPFSPSFDPMANKESYGAQGQYTSPYDDTVDLGFRGRDTSTSLEGRIGKDGVRRRSGLGKAIDTITDYVPILGPIKKGIKFVGSLLPDNPNGPGGGTYGIGGLSDAQKDAYNTLATSGALFKGDSGFKTLTGKNFNLSDKQFDKYMSGQKDIYNQMTKDGYEIDDEGNVTFKGRPVDKRLNFQKLKYKESSALFKNKIEAADKAYKEKQIADAKEMAANTKNPDGSTAAYNYAGRDNEFGTHTSTKTNEEAQANQDRGRGQKADGGRAGYFFGGRVNYKQGGRINFRGGGMDMGNESNQTQSANMGGGATGDFSSGEQTMNHNIAMRNAAKQTTPVKNIIDAGSELNYLNNLKNLNLPGIAVGFGVNKFRDFIGKKNKEEDDKLSALPNNNYFADLNAAQIKQLEGPQKMGKEYGNFSDQEILDNITPFGDEETAPATLKDVQTFYGSNGGRAMFKNGGLASIL